MLNGKTSDPQSAPTDFIDLLDDYEYPELGRGQIVTGQVLMVSDETVFLDVGAKRDAIIPYDEVQGLEESWLNKLVVGDEIPVYVTNTPRGDDQLIVSAEKALAENDWDRAEKLLTSEEIVELEIVGYNKGGLLAEFGRLQGFIPNSHIPSLRHERNRQKRDRLKARMMNEIMGLRLVEVDRQRRRLVLSATAVQKEMAEKQLLELEIGEEVEGTVVNITDYGAFINLGYVTGLLHVSKMAWTPVNHPAEELSEGEKLTVIIDDIDTERSRISLNRQALLPNPLTLFAEKHPDGTLIEGVVTNIRDFGAFVVLEKGIEGLVHISEMRLAGSAQPSDALQVGDTVLVRILEIEIDRGRIRLSLRQVSPSEEMEWMMARPAPAPLPVEETTEAESVMSETETETAAESETETEMEAPAATTEAEEA